MQGLLHDSFTSQPRVGGNLARRLTGDRRHHQRVRTDSTPARNESPRFETVGCPGIFSLGSRLPIVHGSTLDRPGSIVGPCHSCRS